MYEWGIVMRITLSLSKNWLPLMGLILCGMASQVRAQIIPPQLHPNLARGAASGKSLERYDWDSVNVFNGNLNITIPLGIEYPLTRDFRYRLSVTYNSNAWDMDQPASSVSANPLKHSNAGFGWDLSFGRLVPPRVQGTQVGPWIYISPDGAWHPFYSTLHPGSSEIDPGEATSYTRDGEYYRMRSVDSATRVVESPDGLIRTFSLIGTDWKLTELADRFANKVSINYATANLWTITDTHGRTHQIFFKADPSGYYPAIVDRVVLAAFAGSTASYTFTYTVSSVTRPSVDTDPATAATVSTPLLSRVSLPDGSAYAFAYHSSQFQDVSGRLASMQLPTLGRVNWTYTRYSFASAGLPTALATIHRSNIGVGARALTDAAGAETGEWSYTPALSPFNQQDAEMSNTVQTPLGDKTVYYFNVNTVSTTAPWHRAGYGVPGTHNQRDTSGTRALASRVFDCDAAGNNCNPLRSSYVRYEQDSEPDPSSPDVAVSSNRREASTRTVYHDDAENGVERFSEINRSDFDGLGHYRQVDTNGNFGSGDVRKVFTNYDVATGSYPSPGYSMPAPSSAWVLHIYNRQKITEAESSRVMEFCYDRQTGFRKRTRLLQSTSINPVAAAADVVIAYTADVAGQTSQERYYGGDVQALGTTTLCSLALPGADQHQIGYTYQYGAESSSRYHASGGALFGPKFVDQDIDRNTGLVKVSRNSAGIATQYEYDAMGRLIWVKPAAGHGAWTEHRYTVATGTGGATGAKKFTHNYTNGGATLLTYYAEVQDSFGRIFWEQTWMPDNTYPNRYKQFNALGWKTAESEFGLEAPKYAQYLDYDPAGRVRTVRPPDGSQHDTIYRYLGVRTVIKTQQKAVSYNKTTGQINEEPRATDTIYDRQGREWKKIRHYRDSFGSWREQVTINSYDVAGHLLETVQGGQRLGALKSYDGRGFLTVVVETGETKSSLQIDALGNPQRSRRYDHVKQTTVEVTNTYDRAGRITRIVDANNAARPWKEFFYADANGAGDWRAGKLWQTKRYNDMSRFLPSVGVAIVTETYTYGGIGGRVSQFDIEYSDQIGRTEKFFQTYAYDEMGKVIQIGYPNDLPGASSIDLGRSRTVTYAYNVGRQTGVGGSYNAAPEIWANSIAYHPSGLVKQVVHSNGVVDNITIDADSITKVASVSTTGVRTGGNFVSGDFQYDGTERVARIGDQYFVNEQGYQPPPISTVPPSVSPCDTGYTDQLGMVYASTDSQCVAKTFYYYSASDRLYKVEDGVREEKAWYLADVYGRLLTEYVTVHTHYLPWPTVWQYTRDNIFYLGGFTLAQDEKRRDAPPITHHYHTGYGSRGMITDRNAARVID